MEDINDLHRKLCPEKTLGNFWKSSDFKAAHAAAGNPEIRKIAAGHRGQPASTLVPPLIAMAFIHWADPELFYEQLKRRHDG